MDDAGSFRRRPNRSPLAAQSYTTAKAVGWRPRITELFGRALTASRSHNRRCGKYFDAEVTASISNTASRSARRVRTSDCRSCRHGRSVRWCLGLVRPPMSQQKHQLRIPPTIVPRCRFMIVSTSGAHRNKLLRAQGRKHTPSQRHPAFGREGTELRHSCNTELAISRKNAPDTSGIDVHVAWCGHTCSWLDVDTPVRGAARSGGLICGPASGHTRARRHTPVQQST